jgi:hypothetical protein
VGGAHGNGAALRGGGEEEDGSSGALLVLEGELRAGDGGRRARLGASPLSAAAARKKTVPPARFWFWKANCGRATAGAVLASAPESPDASASPMALRRSHGRMRDLIGPDHTRAGDHCHAFPAGH